MRCVFLDDNRVGSCQVRFRNIRRQYKSVLFFFHNQVRFFLRHFYLFERSVPSGINPVAPDQILQSICYRQGIPSSIPAFFQNDFVRFIHTVEPTGYITIPRQIHYTYLFLRKFDSIIIHLLQQFCHDQFPLLRQPDGRKHRSRTVHSIQRTLALL